MTDDNDDDDDDNNDDVVDNDFNDVNDATIGTTPKTPSTPPAGESVWVPTHSGVWREILPYDCEQLADAGQPLFVPTKRHQQVGRWCGDGDYYMPYDDACNEPCR